MGKLDPSKMQRRHVIQMQMDNADKIRRSDIEDGGINVRQGKTGAEGEQSGKRENISENILTSFSESLLTF